MVRNFLKVAWRSLFKHKGTTLTNIFGLALGISASLIIFIVVRYETSFDDFHEKADRIYRVNFRQENENNIIRSGFNYYPLGEAIRDEVSGVEHVTQIHFDRSYQYSIDEENFHGKFGFFVDQEFFEVFDVKWLIGSPKLFIDNPKGVAISDWIAKKHFRTLEDAIGKTIHYNAQMDLVISGIVETPPSNTDLPYTMLIPYQSFKTVYPDWASNWDDIKSGSTFIVKEEQQDIQNVKIQLDALVDKYLKPEIAQKTRLSLMYLDDNHDRNYNFNSFTYDFPVPIMVILSILSGILLFGGMINYINLTIAQSFSRAREIGIRKANGSNRFQQLLQHVTETFVITTITVLFAGCLTWIGLNIFNQEFNYPAFRINPIADPVILLFLLMIDLMIVMIAGLYPAFVLSRYNPLQALKGDINIGLDSKGRYQRFSVREVLVVVQFIGSLLVIIISLIIFNQISYMHNKPLGFNMDKVMYIQIPLNAKASSLVNFREEVLKSGEISQLSFSNVRPQSIKYNLPYLPDESILLNFNEVDEHYIPTLGIEILAGENFTPGDQKEIIINEVFCKKLSMTPEGVIGSSLAINDQDLQVVGVVRDYHYGGVERPIGSLYLINTGSTNMAFVKFLGDDQLATSGVIREAWRKTFPDDFIQLNMLENFVYSFGFFEWFGTFFAIFGLLSILIGCMGLYGLATFMTLQRSKEIGIRKVMGASVMNLVLKLNKQFFLLLVISYLIAAPLGSLVGNKLLAEFPERTTQDLWIYALAFSVLLVTAFLSVMYKSVMAAIRNPVDTLRYE